VKRKNPRVPEQILEVNLCSLLYRKPKAYPNSIMGIKRPGNASHPVYLN